VVDRRMTVREFKKKIFEFFRPIIKSPEFMSQQSYQKKSEAQILEEEYKFFFESP
jgi:hypothetical protein